jgi:hypothetical protein
MIIQHFQCKQKFTVVKFSLHVVAGSAVEVVVAGDVFVRVGWWKMWLFVGG